MKGNKDRCQYIHFSFRTFEAKYGNNTNHERLRK